MLSSLQQFILLRCLEDGGKIERDKFRGFYKTKNPAPRVVQDGAKEKYQEQIITKSLTSLIDRGLLIGYGKRTPHKWFVTNVRLTKKGKKMGQILLEERQVKLPLR